MKKMQKKILIFLVLAIAMLSFSFQGFHGDSTTSRTLVKLQITIEEVRVTDMLVRPRTSTWYALYFQPYYMRLFGTNDQYGELQDADSQYFSTQNQQIFPPSISGYLATYTYELDLTWTFCMSLDQTDYSKPEITMRFWLYRYYGAYHNYAAYINYDIGDDETSYDTTYTAITYWACYGGILEIDFKVCLI